MATASDTTKEEKEKSNSGFSSLMNFVPSAYYDLIARVCPGMAFWIAISFKMPFLMGHQPAAPGHMPAMALSDISGPMLFVLVVLSYVSGIVLTGFSIVWDWISLLCLSPSATMREHLGLTAPKGTPFSSRWKLVSSQIDAVVKRDDGAGRVLIKAMAEVTLCQNLLSGLFVLACIGYYSDGQSFFSPLLFSQFYVPIALALFLSMVFRQAMFLGRVNDLHRLYVPAELSRRLPRLE
jgi:hypothetical protein